MMRHTIYMLLCCLCTFTVAMAQASQRYKRQGEYKDDFTPRWAIDAHIGGSAVAHAGIYGGNLPLYRSGSTSQLGMATRLRAEYFVSGTQIGIKAGYEHEELTLLKGDTSYSLSEILLGGRWRPAPAYWWIQPYLGAEVLWALDTERNHLDMGVTQGAFNYAYHVQGQIRTPRFSTGPVVGTDIYIFSCIALQVEYSYRLALASHYHATYTDNRQGNPTTYHGQPHRHVLSMGLKVDFPFHFTEGDKRGLIQELLDLY